MCAVVVVLTLLLDLLTHTHTPVAAVPVAAHVVLAVYLVVLFFIDKGAKASRLMIYSNHQKYLKLSFLTRLGKNSPIGEHEDEIRLEDAAAAPETAFRATPWSVLRWGFFRWVSVDGGRQEENCICCAHPKPGTVC
jgi:hypothetical protein